jgi:hypothetical protein
VVLQAVQSVTAGELREYCRQKLAAYKVPKHIQKTALCGLTILNATNPLLEEKPVIQRNK